MATTDISWDPIKRDINFASNGDFEINENCSVQNGAILLEARVMNITNPSFGIGYNSQVLGGATSQAAFQLNRWVSQVQSDSGKSAWKRLPNLPNDEFDFESFVDYQGT